MRKHRPGHQQRAEQHQDMWRDGSRLIPTLIYEILCRLVLLLVILLLQCVSRRTVPRALYINEYELRDDYRYPRIDSIVPPWAIMVLLVLLPLLIMSLPSIILQDFSDTIQAFLAWTLGLALNAIVTETLKYFIGRPRPDFFYRCFPNGVMTSTKCTGKPRDVMDGRRSFPSGHSSFAFCSLSFVSIWMCGRLGLLAADQRQKGKILLCMLPLTVAAAIAVSRLYDNHHHWEDVLAGTVIGSCISFCCYCYYYHPPGSELAGQPFLFTVNRLIESPSISHTEIRFFKEHRL